jgi:Na+/melibiose symporter-like transporter
LGAAAASFLMLAAGNNPFALLGCLVVYGLFTAITANQVFTVMASFADEIRECNGIQMSEILAATSGFTYRTGAAVASGIAPLVLALTGYMSPIADSTGNLVSVAQTPTALLGIKALFIFGTAGGMILAGAIMLRFRSAQAPEHEV